MLFPVPLLFRDPGAMFRVNGFLLIIKAKTEAERENQAMGEGIFHPHAHRCYCAKFQRELTLYTNSAELYVDRFIGTL